MINLHYSIDSEDNETIKDISPKPYTDPMIEGDFPDIVALWLMGDVEDISVLPT